MPRPAVPGPAWCDAQPPSQTRASTVPSTRAETAGAQRGLTRSCGIALPSYMSNARQARWTLGSEAIRHDADGEREEVGLIPAQQRAKILAHLIGRAACARRTHDAAARRPSCGHLAAPADAGAPTHLVQVVH